MKFVFLSLTLILTFNLNSQADFPLSFWSDVMINANDPENRQVGFQNFYEGLKNELENGNPAEFEFEKIAELSILEDSLKSFKLVSWQMQEADDTYKYYGFIIKEDGSYYELQDAFKDLDDIEYLELNEKEWLGGIYYNLIEVGDKYFLFSYRQNDKFSKTKSFDCLSFDQDGSPILGAEAFRIPMKDTRDIVKNRLIFTYSADAILSLNYNVDMNMVVHDHLMQITGQIPGQGPTMVPDGTYEGYQFKEGQWVYEEKLFHHTYDEAPRPQQILGNGKKDLFGKTKKN